jgi:beta-barrel assembly-enhancing protease
MQVESVRLEAAVQLKDTAQIDTSLAFLKAHRADAPREYLRALILTGQADLAAQNLIERLLDPVARQDALERVQNFAPTPHASRAEQEFDAQWRALIARPDVQAAIRKIGRIESYALELTI